MSAAARFRELYSIIENCSDKPEALQRCRAILDTGLDVNCKPPEPESDQHYKLLHLAAYQGRPAFCSLLLEYGADPHDFYGGSSPLHEAVEYCWMDACRALVQGGANPSFVPDPPWKEYLTPFQFLVSVSQDADAGRARFIRLFVEELGADLSQKTIDGKSVEDLAEGRSAMQALLRSLATERAIAAGMEAEAGAERATSPVKRSGFAPL